ncbi:hypothetical protein EJ05DRAFT_309614 [Pseudovirgaria hyperparasitica]|uniref:Uncharacterized protein n=1 Tax=Pseudovirgaria hyperparasitica TaxID=470096 RepID=A0A6A6WB42_9PEZI|nr:uncharacterized protein EJ05DRAFT_309614 [Pseudovirgaria hyperparasitica]KAF2759785.1 hypothetical protein EJ05DRAFT_309614 [Pseudovirgaria hyperparasitica]
MEYIRPCSDTTLSRLAARYRNGYFHIWDRVKLIEACMPGPDPPSLYVWACKTDALSCHVGPQEKTTLKACKTSCISRSATMGYGYIFCSTRRLLQLQAGQVGMSYAVNTSGFGETSQLMLSASMLVRWSPAHPRVRPGSCSAFRERHEDFRFTLHTRLVEDNITSKSIYHLAALSKLMSRYHLVCMQDKAVVEAEASNGARTMRGWECVGECCVTLVR